MYKTYNNLSNEQRTVAIQRLTALWAFCESGLGGIMHALQIPFTGLAVGGFAVLIIILIAQLSAQRYRQIFQSLLIVLIVKAAVSPYTPFPAYIAVSFQALLGFVLFSLLRINLLSILLLSVFAMLESAVQKLLILTLFFGQSLWKATDSMMDFIATQFGMSNINGSQWIIGIYLLTYLIGGICIAIIAFKISRGFSTGNNSLSFKPMQRINQGNLTTYNRQAKSNRNKLWFIAIILVIISVALFAFAADTTKGWIVVIKTFCYTSAVIMTWYMLITPLFAKLIQQVLQKNRNRYSTEVAQTLSFLPVLKQLTTAAWKESAVTSGWRRGQVFVTTLINWSLTYPDHALIDPSFKETA